MAKRMRPGLRLSTPGHSSLRRPLRRFLAIPAEKTPAWTTTMNSPVVTTGPIVRSVHWFACPTAQANITWKPPAALCAVGISVARIGAVNNGKRRLLSAINTADGRRQESPPTVVCQTMKATPEIIETPRIPLASIGKRRELDHRLRVEFIFYLDRKVWKSSGQKCCW